MVKSIPVHIVTGFLGSGKTTAIINWLRNKNEQEQWAVLINEFGKVSIDFETLSPQATGNEKVYNIAGGCICCSARHNFEQDLKQIITHQNFDRIIVEPSGLGGADMISSIIKSIPELKLMPLICLVSAKSIDDSRYLRLPLYCNQIVSSDILIISQCDLLEGKDEVIQVLERVKVRYKNKLHYFVAENGKASNLALQTEPKTNANLLEKMILHTEALSDKNFQSESLELNGKLIFDETHLLNLFQSSGILRAKGYINTEKGWKFVNYTLTGFSSETCNERDKGMLVLIADKSVDLSVFR